MFCWPDIAEKNRQVYNLRNVQITESDNFTYNCSVQM